jgi:DnaK suppressor protein
MAKKPKGRTAKTSVLTAKRPAPSDKRGTRGSKRPAAAAKPAAIPSRSASSTKVVAPPLKSTPSKPAATAPAVAPAVNNVAAPLKVVPPAGKRNGEVEEFRQLLLSLRARVRGDVEQMTTEALDRNGEGTESKSPTHLAELGTETYEQDFALRRVENERELLDEINEALARINKGTFGLCVHCLEAGIAPHKAMIPRARLRVIPYAKNCVECERKRERWGR